MWGRAPSPVPRSPQGEHPDHERSLFNHLRLNSSSRGETSTSTAEASCQDMPLPIAAEASYQGMPLPIAAEASYQGMPLRIAAEGSCPDMPLGIAAKVRIRACLQACR